MELLFGLPKNLKINRTVKKMTKKRIGKGLSALIPDESQGPEASAETDAPKQEAQTEQGPPPQAPSIAPEQPKPMAQQNKPPVVPQEPDPLFVENLKKEREKRVRAIEAMNEVIRKYNTHK